MCCLELLGGSALGLLGQRGMHVRHNTASSDGGLTEELVELFIVLHCQLNVARVNAILLMFLGGVARELYRKVQRADGGRSGPVLA